MRTKDIEPTDEQLLTQYKKGNHENMGILYNRYFDKVYHKCVSFVKNRDEGYDLAQDTMLKAFEKIDTFQQRSSFSTWLYRITCTECLLYLRRQKKYCMIEADEQFDLADRTEDVEDALQISQNVTAIDSFMHLLSEEDQALLKMKYWKDASVIDIQQALHLATASAVKMRLQRARHKVLHLYHAQPNNSLQIELMSDVTNLK